MAPHSDQERRLLPYGTHVMHGGEICKIAAYAVPFKGHPTHWRILLPHDSIPDDISEVGYILKPLDKDYEKTVPAEEIRLIRPS